MRYLTLNEVLDLYGKVMEQSGGAVGLRSKSRRDEIFVEPRVSLSSKAPLDLAKWQTGRVEEFSFVHG